MLDGVRAITFDCYGALVDRDAGIHAFIAPILGRKMPNDARPKVDPEVWCARFRVHHDALLATFRPYREVLVRGFELAMRDFGLEIFLDEGPALARSVERWPVREGATRALRRLARRYRLALIADMDEDLLAETVGQLQAPFSSLVTSEAARAYKPDPRPFLLALERLGLPAEAVLHVAADAARDLAPARARGLRTAKVGGDEADGADLAVPSVVALADALGV